MAFLRPHFESDVFVSYSHGVPARDGAAPLRDWTRDLVRTLETDIRHVGPEFDDLHIWRDEQMDGTIHLTDELRGAVKSAGILMIVMSPRYLASAWCKDELDWFMEQVERRGRDHGCVFVVRAQPTEETSWPDFLRDSRGHPLVGFRFHEAHQDAMPYGWRGARTHHDFYVQELDRLRRALVKRLREVRGNAESRARIETPTVAAPATGPRYIYLHARPEHATACDEVKRLLFQDGIPALSLVADPGRELADLTRESRVRIEAAKRCHALALLRGEGDERFMDDLWEIGFDERNRIQDARGAPLPCAVFDRSGRILPIDVSGLGIERFDLHQDDWRGKFQVWFNQARAQPSTLR